MIRAVLFLTTEEKFLLEEIYTTLQKVVDTEADYRFSCVNNFCQTVVQTVDWTEADFIAFCKKVIEAGLFHPIVVDDKISALKMILAKDELLFLEIAKRKRMSNNFELAGFVQRFFELTKILRGDFQGKEISKPRDFARFLGAKTEREIGVYTERLRRCKLIYNIGGNGFSPVVKGFTKYDYVVKPGTEKEQNGKDVIRWSVEDLRARRALLIEQKTAMEIELAELVKGLSTCREGFAQRFNSGELVNKNDLANLSEKYNSLLLRKNELSQLVVAKEWEKFVVAYQLVIDDLLGQNKGEVKVEPVKQDIAEVEKKLLNREQLKFFQGVSHPMKLLALIGYFFPRGKGFQTRDVFSIFSQLGDFPKIANRDALSVLIYKNKNLFASVPESGNKKKGRREHILTDLGQQKVDELVGKLRSLE